MQNMTTMYTLGSGCKAILRCSFKKTTTPNNPHKEFSMRDILPPFQNILLNEKGHNRGYTSSKWFCMGVPERSTLRLQFRLSSACQA